MKINFFFVIISIFSIAQVCPLHEKTDIQNRIMFSRRNFLSSNPELPKLMEDIFIEKSIKFEGDQEISNNLNSNNPQTEGLLNRDSRIKQNNQKRSQTANNDPLPFPNMANLNQEKINLKDLQVPEIVKLPKNDPNPLNRPFGETNMYAKMKFENLFDYNSIVKVQEELLLKLKNEIYFGVAKKDPNNITNLHVEKVPVIKNFLN